MPKKQIFSDDQIEQLWRVAKRVYRKKFEHLEKPQIKMGLALGISQQTVSKLLLEKYPPSLAVATELAVLDGHESLEDIIGPFALPKTAKAALESGDLGLPNLDVCVDFHAAAKRWHPWTIAAAKAGYFGPTDFAPPDWVGKLDQLEKVMERAKKGA